MAIISPSIGTGVISVAFVRPFVRLSVPPSVAYIANNSRTQRSSVPKFGRTVSHLRCDSHNSFKVKRSKVRVTRPITANTHRAPYLLNGKACELQDWYTGGGRRPAWATGAMTSKVEGQFISSHRLYVSSLPLLNSGNRMHCCVTRGGQGTPCRHFFLCLVLRWCVDHVVVLFR